MAFRVEIFPPGAPVYSLPRLFEHLAQAQGEGMAQSNRSYAARFNVVSIDQATAERHFALRDRYDELNPPAAALKKPVSTTILLDHYKRTLD